MRAVPVLDLSPPRVELVADYTRAGQWVRVEKRDWRLRRWSIQSFAVDRAPWQVDFYTKRLVPIVEAAVRQQWDLRKAYRIKRRARRVRR